MAEQPAPAGGGRVFGWFKALAMAGFGLASGVAATYATAVVDRVAKPGKPVANFAVAADGLTVTCQNQATGESGWWDFGDGSALEPFAPDQHPKHTYPKPGSYAVKLTVRNFLMEDAERSVPVDLAPSSAGPAALPPTITSLAAEPVNPQPVAPATFRIKGEVKNAERVIWDLGDGKLEVTSDTGPFERLVVFDKPGQYPIQLIGSSGKTAVKQAATVTVVPPTAGTLFAVLRVVHAGSRVERMDVAETVAVAVPAAAAADKGFEKVLAVRPGFAATAAKVGPVKGAAVRNVTATVSPDKKTVRVAGEWAATGDAGRKAAGGPDVMIPVTVSEERFFPLQAPPETVSGPVAGWNQPSATLTLPAAPRWMTNPERRMALEIREASADGRSRVLVSVPDLKLPWTGPMTGSLGQLGRSTASAVKVGEQVRVSVTR